MIRNLCILALLLSIAPTQSAPADLALRATWQGASIARIEWRQPAGVAITCLSNAHALIQCWRDLPAGHMIMLVGGPLTDGNIQPILHTVYRLWQNGQITEAALRGVVFVPMAQ